MEQADFDKLLNIQLEDLTNEQKLVVLRRLKKMIPNKDIYIRSKESCKVCGRNYDGEDIQYIYKTEIRYELTQTDGGYGDNDIYDNVEYIVKYGVCPACDSLFEVSKDFVRIANAKHR